MRGAVVSGASEGASGRRMSGSGSGRGGDCIIGDASSSLVDDGGGGGDAVFVCLDFFFFFFLSEGGAGSCCSSVVSAMCTSSVTSGAAPFVIVSGILVSSVTALASCDCFFFRFFSDVGFAASGSWTGSDVGSLSCFLFLLADLCSPLSSLRFFDFDGDVVSGDAGIADIPLTGVSLLCGRSAL